MKQNNIDTAPQVLGELFGALSMNMDFLVLRNYEGLPKDWGNDVDILIRPCELSTGQEITRGVMRTSSNGALAKEMNRLNCWSVNLPCRDRDLHVDFYTAMSKAWVTYASSSTILDSRREVHPLFHTPDPMHELLLIAAKELFAYGRIRRRYHDKLAGNQREISMAAATTLFSGQLTDNGCSLIASALSDPNVTGRPSVRPTSLLDPCAILRWARQRGNSWQPLIGSH